MAFFDEGAHDRSWSSQGLPPGQALRAWRDWACEALAPMDVDALDVERFGARWASRSVGPLRFIELAAAPQRVAHPRGDERRSPDARFQLVYCVDSPISARAGAKRFDLQLGEFVLLDNAQPYEMRMEHANTSIDVVMPDAWLERWLPDPIQYVGAPHSANVGWGAPLGGLLAMVAREVEHASLPRRIIADQVGALIALAIDRAPQPVSRHKAQLARRILSAIEERHDDPELDAAAIAQDVGISKRYLHAVLAETATTFLEALASVRLNRACELLRDPRCDRLPVAEVSWRCGYRDPSYFARAFRRRFGVSPTEWRSARQR